MLAVLVLGLVVVSSAVSGVSLFRRPPARTAPARRARQDEVFARAALGYSSAPRLVAPAPRSLGCHLTAHSDFGEDGGP